MGTELQAISSSALMIKSTELANYNAQANNLFLLTYKGVNLTMDLKTDENMNQH